MSVCCKPFFQFVLLTACLLACGGSSGCSQWKWPERGLGKFLLPVTDRAEQAGDTGTSRNSDSARPADRAILARNRDDDGRSVWIRAVTQPEPESTSPAYRWTYPDLAELSARPAKQRPNFRRYLADKDPIVAANAAIALGRSGDARGAERLAETVRSPRIDLPLRCAAIEALGQLKDPSVVPLLRELVDQYGRRKTQGGVRYNAELHAELLRGLARHVDPADDQRFVDALAGGASKVRLETLRAWVESRQGRLPLEVVELCEDPDRRVRGAALMAVAKRRHPQAQSQLVNALQDHDTEVRTAAIAALGELGGREAQAVLEKLPDEANERVRAAAVDALARMGATKAVLEAADDKKWRVRKRVAKALRGISGPEGVAVAGRLLEDPSTEVQRQVVLALAAWPLEQAGLILLEAMDSRNLATRSAAADQLAARWPPATGFPTEGSPQRRTAALDDLRGHFHKQFGQIDPAALARAFSDERANTKIAPEQLDRVEQLVRQEDVEALNDFRPELVAALEQLVFQRQQVLPEVIYQSVLARHRPVFGTLDRLTSADLSARRRAADELAEFAKQRPLGRLAMDRLAGLVAGESDQLVWRSVLTAISGNASEPSMRLAYAAIGHPMPEVRRLACEHLAAHPDPKHVKVLVRTLEDRKESVVLAAVRALGRIGRMEDTAPLRQLLSTTSEALRLETAVALARLGDPQGAAELNRLSYSDDPKVLRRVAESMGELADPAFTRTLIRLLDDRVSVRRAALASLPKVVGHDASEVAGQGTASTTELIDRWKQWFSRQAATNGSSGTKRR